MSTASGSTQRRVAAIFDLDCTITRHDTYLAFLSIYLRQNPVRWLRSAWLPIAVAAYVLKLRDNSWLKVRFLKTIAGGATRTQISQSVNRFLNQLLMEDIRPGALKTIRRHREIGHHLLMVTASLDFYVEELGRRLGFESVICTRSSWDQSSKLLGDLEGENCYGLAKLARLDDYFGDERKDWFMIGYSDHHSDSPLLSWVDTAVAVNPTAKLRELAKKNGYEIQDWEFE